MKTIYENLDTSFVNLPALVRYLRGKSFSGLVRVELDGYEAEIVFAGEKQPNARENDRAAGRIAEGEQALQRVLIRARAPGGIVHVYRSVSENESAAIERAKIENGKIGGAEINEVSSAPRYKSAIIENKNAAAQNLSAAENVSRVENEKAIIAGTAFDETNHDAKSNGKTLDFPFDLSNKVEAKAKQNQLSVEDWKMLLSLIGELLRTIDERLASANLNFPAAFQKACAEVSEDYPFFNPDSGALIYRSGKMEMREQVNAKLFVAGINDVLRRILSKLGSNAKYAEAERATVQSILALIHHRKALYEKFYITPQLEKTLRT
ncbi:MAG: hypothetical protein JWN60_699 [Acidobacteria bacterium]|nr:hypothetical protein [Acidobacteriota bacterium]